MDFGSFVLAAATADLDDEPAAREHADAVEFRMDAAEAPLSALEAYDGELPVIATNRARWEGGDAGGDAPGSDADRERLLALAEAAEQPAVEAVDVELASVDAAAGPASAEASPATAEYAPVILDRARAHACDVIVSVHDFDGTPGVDGLRESLSAAVAAGDVGKLAVTAEGVDDALRLLSVTREFAARRDAVATMAMGEPGRHTRAVAPVYGSRIGYAPVDPARATAPGQYDLATLRELVDALGARE